MGRDKGAATVDGLAPIGLESVGDIIDLDAKEHSQEIVEQPIQDQLGSWIVDGAAPSNESAAKDTVVPLVQLEPVANDIAAVVRLVRHHDHGGVAFHLVESLDDSPPEAVKAGVLDRDQLGHSLFHKAEDIPGRVGATVVNHYDFVGNMVEIQFQV